MAFGVHALLCGLFFFFFCIAGFQQVCFHEKVRGAEYRNHIVAKICTTTTTNKQKKCKCQSAVLVLSYF